VNKQLLQNLNRVIQGSVRQIPFGAARQVVRWLAHDQRQTSEHITAVLHDALRSPDWELRLSAALAAARLGAVELHPAIRRMELPRDNRSGIDARERQAVFALRQACLSLLTGETPPPASSGPLDYDDSQAMRGHIMRCAAGVETAHRDWIWLLARSLSEPLPEPQHPTEPLPPGVVQDDEERFYLALGEQELCWVAPGEYWLGERDVVRAEALAQGFFILRGQLVGNPPELLDLEEAVTAAHRISDVEGAEVRLPTPDEWEMAARGMDGRLYPWGNSYETGWQALYSPCGAMGLAGGPGEWTVSPAPENELLACGYDRSLRCARRSPVDPNTRLRVRLVISYPDKSGT